MKAISKEELKKLKTKYKIGTRVKLLKMNDIQAPEIGTLGTVRAVDDIGTVFVRWDNGLGLGVVYGQDECHILD